MTNCFPRTNWFSIFRSTLLFCFVITLLFINQEAKAALADGSSSQGGSAISYQWTTSDGNIVSEETSTAPLIDAAGTYNIVVTNNNNGCTSADPEGGAAGYSFSSSNGETTESIENLAPGLYTVAITDANHCTSSETVTVNSFNCLVTASISGNDVDCFDGTNGSATASLNGGNGPYNYQWSNGGSTATISHLAAGTYEVTISDIDNCPATALITIEQPEAISLSLISSTAVDCAGMANGSATVITTSGNNNITYSWSNGASGETVNNLVAGAYLVTATDGNQCSTTLDITVTEPNALSLSINGDDETSAGASDGTATANPTGGNTPYTYLWSNGTTSAIVNDLAPGNYSVIITDNNNCTESENIVINGVSCNLVYNINSNEVTCFAGSDDNIAVRNLGGALLFNNNWSTGATTASIHSVNCTLNANINTTNTTCAGNNDGPFVVASVSGINDPAFAALVSIHPNPTNGEVQIALSETLSGDDVQIEVFSIMGQALGTSVIAQPGNQIYRLDISNEMNGVYLVKLRIGEEVLVKQIVLSRN